MCGQCHKLYGEGGALGPDLTGSGRHEINYLIENIVDPSAVVDSAYYLNTLTLKDGRVLSGIMPEGLLQAFTPEQQRDLLAYLMGNAQVPLAK